MKINQEVDMTTRRTLIDRDARVDKLCRLNTSATLANLLKDIVVKKLKRQKMMRLSSTRKHMVI